MKARLLRGLLMGFITSQGLMLAGCSTLSHETNGLPDLMDSPQNASESQARVEFKPELTANGMNAAMMTQILAAEMLVEKGGSAQAFQLIYPLAEQTRDKGLVKRAFQLSMGTYQEEAIAAANQLWLEVEPENPAPWRAAYLMSIRKGNVDQAWSQWQHYRSISTNVLTDDILSAAQRIARSAQQPEAMQFYVKVLQENPQVWQSHYGYGVLAAHYNENDLAEKHLNLALKQLETNESDSALKKRAEQQVYHLLSKVYLRLANIELGITALTNYLKSYPEDWLIQERLARLEVKAERFVEAENRYEAILKAKPTAHTSRLSLALLQIEKGSYSKARENLAVIVNHKAYQSVGHYYLGVLFQESGELEVALQHFEQVVNPPYVLDAALHQAEILYPIKGLDAAMAKLDAIELKTDEQRIKVLRAKAIFQRAEGRFDQSVDFYSQALALKPNHEEMLLAQSILLYELQRFDEYVKNLERVIKNNPNSVDALNALGYFYVERNIELPLAGELLKRALQLSPNSYYVLDSVGWWYFQQQEYVTAEQYLRQALSIELDREVLTHLITTLWMNNKRSEAEALWLKHRSDFAKDKAFQTLIENLK